MTESDPIQLVQEAATFHVLVVDDDSGMLRNLCQLVELDGYRATGVESGEEALQRIAAEKVDIVVTELFMPGIDGWELLDQVKKEKPSIHVVVTTGNITEQAEKLLTSRKADGYLVKPVQPRRLHIALRALLFPRNLDRVTEVVALDPDRTVLGQIERALEARGVYVESFTELPRAAHRIREDPPDLLIIETDLGKKDGFELCAGIRGNRRLPYVPILIISGEPSPENVKRAARLHINGFLTKPFTDDALCQRVLKLLRQGRARAPQRK